MARKKPASKRKQLSSSARMSRLGKHPILLWVTQDQWATLKCAADLEMRPVSQFVVFHAMNAAAALCKAAYVNPKPAMETTHE